MAARNILSFFVDLVATRIAVRVTLAVVLVVILLSCIFGMLLIRSHHRFSVHQVENNAYLVSETIKSSTRHAMLVNQPQHVHEIIADLGRQPGIDMVRIYNKFGEVIYASERDSIGTFAAKDSETCVGCHAESKPLNKLKTPHRARLFEGPNEVPYLGVINPIYNFPECSATGCHPPVSEQAVLGVLDVTFSLAESETNLRDNLRYAVWLLLGLIVGIAFVIWISLRYLVSRPVNNLLRATEAVASGDLTYRLTGDPRDELGQLASSFNGMTESLQDAKVQIYRSNKLASLGRLAAGVAHEINNPLTGVLSFSSFLLKRAPEGSEDKEDLETIVRETKRCRTIVKGLLDFSRQVQPRKTRACFNTAVRRALGIVRNQLQVDKTAVNTELTENLPEVMADSDQLVQLILNLVVNASDAMKDEEGSQIDISTCLIKEEEREVVEVVVSDNGPGIPQENVERIFDPFFSTKGNMGTGLGLSVVWGIIDEHDGTIRVNTAPGKGASFVLRIPVYKNKPLIKEDGKS